MQVINTQWETSHEFAGSLRSSIKIDARRINFSQGSTGKTASFRDILEPTLICPKYVTENFPVQMESVPNIKFG
jgi:hypothetical protein